MIDKAAQKMAAFLNRQYPGAWKNLQFEHSDAAGYWFTFELINDARRQTWCIRPEEINKNTEGGARR